VSVLRIADLVPQSGAMVLIDEITSHDERTLTCRARSHARPDHPLAHRGMLPVWAGVEYAAQAMAAHFTLQSRFAGRPTLGLLGALRDVRASVTRLDDVRGPLFVAVERLSRDAAGSIYAFSLAAGDGSRELLRGRATVVQREAEQP
jgi:predicted hotdog family 3-hydroxylacyl-ACP dehydratase